MAVPRALRFVVLPLWLALAPPSAMARPQDPVEKKAQETPQDTFFAGTVTEVTPERITVSRVNLGKKEKRVFRMTSDTKCEGKLKTKVRVTVKYVTTEDGETAELIIVRAQEKKK
jgi:hypothetical protein